MTREEFKASLTGAAPPMGLPVERSGPLTGLWWDAKGDWARAHEAVDSLETPEGMAVHAYLHRKEGDASNAAYWYQRSGRKFYREKLAEEWEALVEELAG